MDSHVSPLRPGPARPVAAIATLLFAIVAVLLFFLLGRYALPIPPLFQGGR